MSGIVSLLSSMSETGHVDIESRQFGGAGMILRRKVLRRDTLYLCSSVFVAYVSAVGLRFSEKRV